MADTSPTRIAKRRTTLLKAVRSAAVTVANGADRHGDYVAVETWAFDALIRRINCLMDFEDQHDGP
ncbi:MAG: hypothetical protein QOC81_490 [Thermoanaerobaculia bacterium]|jgi:hypothetical protein|nr:hypothetical protein [Thermoanaerobaculia bacterium]